MCQMIRFVGLRLCMVMALLSIVLPEMQAKEMGTVSSCTVSNGKVVVKSENGETVIEPYSDYMVKVTPMLSECRLQPKKSASVVMSPIKQKIKIEKNRYCYIASIGKVKVAVDRATSALSFFCNDKLKVYERSTDYGADSTVYSFVNDKSQAFYGAGERGMGVNLQGDTLVMFNKQNYAYGKGDRTSQMNITMPYIASSNGYALFFDDYSSSRMTLGNDLDYVTKIKNPVSYYFIGSQSDDLAGLTENFTALTGRQDLAPFWSLGYITSKYGYETQEETEAVVRRFKQEGYPLDGIVLDLYWYGKETDMGRFEWNKEQWRDHRGMLAGFDSIGVKTIIISQPYLNKTGAIDNYNSAAALGLLARDSLGNVHDVTTWVGDAGMLDVSNPATKEWLWRKYKSLTEDGVDGWWGDLGEPEVHPLGIRHYSGESAAEYHNRYGNDWSKIIYDGFRKDFPRTRLMTLMRGGTAGLQHYSVFPWSTDVSRSWGGLQAQIPIMINSSLSGLGYMSHDVGGFAVDPQNPIDAELYARWLELGLFTPILRTHSTVDAEPYNYTMPGYQELFKKIIHSRYEWLPYNYTLAYENAVKGIPFVRPMNFYDTATSSLDDVQDQYLWGREVLVAPILDKGAFVRNVVLPSGLWYDLNVCGVAYDGGKTIEYRAPIDVIPVFVRAGAFIPQARYAMQNTSDYTSAKLSVSYYLGPDASGYAMFDDDRNSTNTIENGEYVLVNFKAEPSEESIEMFVDESGKGYASMPAERILSFEVVGLPNVPQMVYINGVERNDWKYNKETKTLTVSYTHSKHSCLKIVR